MSLKARPERVHTLVRIRCKNAKRWITQATHTQGEKHTRGYMWFGDVPISMNKRTITTCLLSPKKFLDTITKIHLSYNQPMTDPIDPSGLTRKQDKNSIEHIANLHIYDFYYDYFLRKILTHLLNTPKFLSRCAAAVDCSALPLEGIGITM